MTFLQSVILGLIQGLTEFIPVSSTGHLILARKIMGLELYGSLSFDAILQLATGLAVLVYFWRDIRGLIAYSCKLIADSFIKKEKREETEIINNKKTILLALIIGTIPAVILGLFLQDYMDNEFRAPYVVAISLIFGAFLFYFAERVSRQKIGQANGLVESAKEIRGPEPELFSDGLTIKKSFLVGLFQCLALVPGMSRSGATISGGLFMGLNREVAIRFSFLLSLPIIFGSGLKKVFDLYQTGALAQIESSLFIASIFAFISGFLAIHFLLKFLKNHSLNYFGVYRIILAIIILIFL